MRDFSAFQREVVNPHQPLLHYLQLMAPALPAYLVQPPANAPHVHYQLPMHLTSCGVQASCGSTTAPPPMTLQSCGAHSNVAEDEGEARPAKKRKLFKRSVAKHGLVSGGAEGSDRGEGGRTESMKQKLRRKMGSAYTIKPWRRPAEQALYPSSSEDEDLGWSVPGEYLRTLFDLPQGYLPATTEDPTRGQRPAAQEDLSSVLPEQPEVPEWRHVKMDGSYLLNEEDDA